jgi:ABC-type multidrug transport system fused ATPase/permease subunit
VDGKDIFSAVQSWRHKIGYVPQSIFLTDDTLRRNIAFGLEDAEIDEQKLRTAVRIAQREKFVATLPRGLDTVVGE